MNDDTRDKTELDSFAKRHGLTQLAPEHIERMGELAPIVSATGMRIPRPADKAASPVERSTITGTVRSTSAVLLDRK